MRFIYCFEELDAIVKDITDESALMYLYLSWLGLSDDEIALLETSDCNMNMRILHTGGRTVYVKDDKIADLLKKFCSVNNDKILPEPDKSKSMAESSGISPIYVYKMGYYMEKLDLKRKNQPEDIMRFKAMIRYIGQDEDMLAREFSEYEQKA